MNLLFGCLGIGFAMISASIVTHKAEAQVAVAAREASVAVEQSSHHPHRYGDYPRFRIEQKGEGKFPSPWSNGRWSVKARRRVWI